MIRYHLLVLNGMESGLTSALDELEPLIIGSAESSRLRINGEGVKPSHAKVTVEHGQVWLENLASIGVMVNERLVMGKTILPDGGTFVIGNTSIQLKSDAPETKRSIVLPFFIVMFILGGLVIALAAVQQQREFIAYVATEDDWHRVYNDLEPWVNSHVEKGNFDKEVIDLLHMAWIRDQSGDFVMALKIWQSIHRILTGTKIPEVTGESSIAAFCSDNHHQIESVLDGKKQRRWLEENLALWGPGQYYVNVFWWFVNMRIELLKKKLD